MLVSFIDEPSLNLKLVNDIAVEGLFYLDFIL